LDIPTPKERTDTLFRNIDNKLSTETHNFAEKRNPQPQGGESLKVRNIKK